MNEGNDLTQEIVEPERALPPLRLRELSEKLQRAAQNAGWKELMPVQAKGLPYLLAERDLMVQSRTGSGKTGAFLLAILDRIDTQIDACQALVLVPTRELAQQVANEAKLLAQGTDLRVVPVYGGVSYRPQIAGFKKGAHLVVGTPGRILDHLLKRNLRLDKLRILVFDEADRMLSMGFYPDMREVQRYLPDHAINAYMFSATIPTHVRRLANEFLDEPEYLSLSRDHVHVTDMEHVVYTVPGMDKDRVLVRIIEMENPSSALIFCNTKARVHYVAVVLERFGYDVDELSSDRTQSERQRVMQRLREGKLRFLVTTDVAARGIDIPDLSHVFIYEPPEDLELYIHRAGRTGRAGAGGEAISLVDIVEKGQLRRIVRRYDIELQERPTPTDEDVAALVGQRLTAHLEARLRNRDRLKVERMERFVPVVQELNESEEGQALLAMLLDDYYQQTLQEKPAAPEGTRQRGRRRSKGKRGRKRRK
jgi:ATP-dependent RNA helicase DeaD